MTGTVFIHSVDLAKSVLLSRRSDVEFETSGPVLPLASAPMAAPPPPPCDDIIDPHAWSLEETKQKEDENNRRSEADKKKDAVRAKIRKIREEFGALQVLLIYTCFI